LRVIASTLEAKGFTIHTRTVSVVDLGTEFTAEATLDGRGQSQPDAPAESVYCAREESGCLLLDLGSRVAVSKVNAYSWHRNVESDTDHVRATQKYDLYGFAGDAAPGSDGSPAAAGWTLLARVNNDSYFGRSREFRPAQQPLGDG
jgi:hypothetical protein